MRRIMIIGSGGAGKSTLARILGEITQLPVYHLDTFYWKPGWVPTPNEEWDHLQKELTNREKWIMDGNYSKTFETRMSEADTIIFLDLSRWIAIYRVIKRRVQYHGQTRPSCRSRKPKRMNVEFFRNIIDVEQAGFRACKRCQPDSDQSP